MVEQSWDIVVPPGNDFTSKTFHEWKSAVLAHTDMAEHRLRRLYRLGFTPDDIKADKHHAVFPPPRDTRIRKVAGISPDQIRGKNLGEKKINWMYASALRDVAQAILKYHSLDAKTRARVQKELINFDSLVQLYSHKKS